MRETRTQRDERIARETASFLGRLVRDCGGLAPLSDRRRPWEPPRNDARDAIAKLLRQPGDDDPTALARADEALFALHQAGFDLVAVAGAGI